MKYNRFEETPVWQESRSFVNTVYGILAVNKNLRLDYSLCDQLKRASYSIMLNIAEGFERGSNKDFSHFIDFAKGSAGEVRSILYILLDNKYITAKEFAGYLKKLESISAQLASFKRYLMKTNFKKEF